MKKHFRDKLLTANVCDVIDQDLYWHGIDYIREVYNQVTKIKDKNGYMLTFYRNDAMIENPHFRFICSFLISNEINMPIVNLQFTEIDAFALLDSLSHFIEFNMDHIIIPINNGNTNLVHYQLVLQGRGNDIRMTVSQYAPMYESMIERVTLSLSEDILSDMIYDMYFAYLIDIDEVDENIIGYNDLLDNIIVDRLSPPDE